MTRTATLARRSRPSHALSQDTIANASAPSSHEQNHFHLPPYRCPYVHSDAGSSCAAALLHVLPHAIRSAPYIGAMSKPRQNCMIQTPHREDAYHVDSSKHSNAQSNRRCTQAPRHFHCIHGEVASLLSRASLRFCVGGPWDVRSRNSNAVR